MHQYIKHFLKTNCSIIRLESKIFFRITGNIEIKTLDNFIKHKYFPLPYCLNADFIIYLNITLLISQKILKL